MVTSGITTPLCRRKSRVVKVFTWESAVAIFVSGMRKLFCSAFCRRKLSAQYPDHAVGEGQALGHDGNEIGQELLAEHRLFPLERLELLPAQHIEDAFELGLDGGAARRLHDQPHLADGGVAAEAAY